MDKALLTIEEAAEILSISRSQMYRLIGRRELATIHIGRAVRVPISELQRWVQAGIDAQERVLRTPAGLSSPNELARANWGRRRS